MLAIEVKSPVLNFGRFSALRSGAGALEWVRTMDDWSS